jgi:hypothetical protein
MQGGFPVPIGDRQMRRQWGAPAAARSGKLTGLSWVLLGRKLRTPVSMSPARAPETARDGACAPPSLRLRGHLDAGGDVLDFDAGLDQGVPDLKKALERELAVGFEFEFAAGVLFLIGGEIGLQ